MNLHRFDNLTLGLRGVPSRRHVLAGFLGVLGASVPILSELTAAGKKRKRKKRNGKQARPNEYGCLEAGALCKREAQCCSGICEGKKGKKTCRSHGAGTCSQGARGFCGEGVSAICDNAATCVCARTTAGSVFCGDLSLDAGTGCADCQKDADCAALGFPSGTACVPFATGYCAGNCATSMACMAPCGTELPPEPKP